MVVSLMTGLKIDSDLWINGDPGFDFDYGGIRYDVKSATFYSSPDIKEFPNKNIKAHQFILVGIDSHVHRGYVAGWATREQVESADLRSYGYGEMRSLSYRYLARNNQLGLPVSLLSLC